MRCSSDDLTNHRVAASFQRIVKCEEIAHAPFLDRAASGVLGRETVSARARKLLDILNSNCCADAHESGPSSLGGCTGRHYR